jgi:sugar phosphate isomerase/epimerase
MESTYKICAPTDAVGTDLKGAASLLRGLGLSHCELRTVDGRHVLELSPPARREVAAVLEQEGLAVTLLDSGIGQTAITDGFSPQLARMERALDLATTMGASYVGVYAYQVPPAELERWRGEVVERFARLAELAAAGHVTLLVENRPGSFCHSGQRLGDLVAAVNHPRMGAIFNPAGFVAEKRHPFLTEFQPWPLKNWIRCVRIADGVFEDGRAVLPDQGNAELRELISALSCRSFDGFFSLDPGLEPAPETFRAAYRAFQAMVAALL